VPTSRPRFVVNLLGGFELRHQNKIVITTPAAQRLLAFLATRTTRISRTAVAQALWPDTLQARAAANLRSALWRLRNDYDEGPVSSTPYGLELSPDTTVDIHAVHAMTAELTREAATGVPRQIDPAALSDDVLPEWSEEWLLSTREWFRQVRLHALEALCAHHCREGRFWAALEAGLAAIACEPLRESAHRAVVRVHLAEGNPTEALRQHEFYSRLLREELGVPPSTQFQELIAGSGISARRSRL
jgi:DNA-binding SARP family transcriptional activator